MNFTCPWMAHGAERADDTALTVYFDLEASILRDIYKLELHFFVRVLVVGADDFVSVAGLRTLNSGQDFSPLGN
jgi:hypothetical protein